MDPCMDPWMDPCMDPSMDPSKKSSKFAKTRQKLQKIVKICKKSSKFKKVVKSNVFPWYIRQFCEKVLILLHTFENYAFGASEIDTPIEDQKLDGHFVKRIRRSSRESLIGVIKNAGARPEPHPWGPKKPPGPLQRPRCLGTKGPETPLLTSIFGYFSWFLKPFGGPTPWFF